MTRGLTLLTVVPLLAVYYPGCEPQLQPSVPADQRRIEELWRAPGDIAAADLYHGPWGAGSAPDRVAAYRFVRAKSRGVNPGMTVRDPHGREWSVKQASHDGRAAEGPIEVVLSRVLSAVGYHQPPVYFLPSFELTDTIGTRTAPTTRSTSAPSPGPSSGGTSCVTWAPRSGPRNAYARSAATPSSSRSCRS
jgi:hypothetical protein